MQPSIDVITGALLLTTLAIAVAAALRVGRVPGAAVIGGTMAGILLGPSVIGRVAPDWHERTFVGGAHERRDHELLMQEFAAWRAALAEADRRTDAAMPAPAATRLTEEFERRETAIAAAAALRSAAVAEHRRPLRLSVVALAATVVALSLCAAPCRRTRRTREHATPWSSGAMVIGATSALFCATAAGGIALLVGEPLFGPASLACAAALSVGAWRLGRADLRLARGVECDGPSIVAWASTGATTISLAILAVAATIAWNRTDIGPATGREQTIVVFVGIAAAIAVAVAWNRGRRNARLRRLVAWIVPKGILPTLAALVAVRLEILLDAQLWPLVLVPLLTGDGRWMGGMIGALLLGNRGPGAASRLLLLLGAAGPTQLAIAAIGLWTELLTPGLAIGLVAGTLLVEMTGSVRRHADRAIQELQRSSKDDSS